MLYKYSNKPLNEGYYHRGLSMLHISYYEAI
jgi:hypothetical protein